MIGLGDQIVLIMSLSALLYGIYLLISRKPPLYFRLIVAAVGCHILGYLFNVCEYFVTGGLSGVNLIRYLGSIGCFLFFLTTSYGYMDGIMDDKTPQMRKARVLALAAPVFLIALLIPNILFGTSLMVKIPYTILWIPAILSSYFNLKHAIIPDMGFGFVKAIKPFNVAALAFTVFQLVHLTLWNFCDWMPLLISGILFGSSCVAMIVTADKGIKKWAL